MSILAKYNSAMDNKDEAAMNEVLHDDYAFLMYLERVIKESRWGQGSAT